MKTTTLPKMQGLALRGVNKVYDFTILHEFQNCFWGKKENITHGCIESYEAKVTFLKKCRLSLKLKNEIKTIAFKVTLKGGKNIFVAFHLPANKWLPSIRKSDNREHFDYCRISEILKVKGIVPEKIIYYQNLIPSTLNPISIAIEYENAYHFFDQDYLDDTELKSNTTNTGCPLIYFIFEIQDLFKSFKNLSINFNFFNN